MPATEKFSRNLKTLHVVFAFSCLALLVSTVWMMADDHAGEWREYQKKNFALTAMKRKAKLESARAGIDKQRHADLIADRDDAVAEMKAAQTDLDDINAEIATLSQEQDLKKRKLREQNAETGVARANYDLGVRDTVPANDLAVLFAEFQRRQKLVQETNLALQNATTRLKAEQKKLELRTTDRDRWQAELTAIDRELGQLQTALDTIAPSGFDGYKRKIMEWAILDGFNSHLAYKQDWLPKLKITLGMAKTARFDRCRTCHQNIDLTEAGGVPAFPHGHVETDDLAAWVKKNEYPHPYATHPHPELYATDASPHKVEKFGCTICHDGNGSGTSVQNAEHTPNDPHTGEEWAAAYGWHSNHFWEYPMQANRFIESSCIKCHHNVTELGVNPEFGASAPKVHKGYQLIKKYGCFGCHEIHGYDSGTPIGPDIRLEPQTEKQAKAIDDDSKQVAGNMRKVGPALASVGQKTTKAFIQTWTALPKSFRPSTRMPQFFNLTNQQDFYAKAMQPAELIAISQYLSSKSKDVELLSPDADYRPDADAGRTWFNQRGCINCHQHKGAGSFKPTFGPDLSRIHEKIRREPAGDGKTPFSNWLYTWIRDPERHHPRTKMPNLFLTEYTASVKAGDESVKKTIDPAADIVAFLLSQGPTGDFEELDRRPYLGAEIDPDFTDEEAATLNLETPSGARVTGVIPISPAGRATTDGDANALRLNDILLKIGETPVDSPGSVTSAIEALKVGTVVTIMLQRDRAIMDVDVELDEPANDLARLFLAKTLTGEDVKQTLSTSVYSLNGSSISGDEIELAYTANSLSSKATRSVSSVEVDCLDEFITVTTDLDREAPELKERRGKPEEAEALTDAQVEKLQNNDILAPGVIIYWTSGRNIGRISVVKDVDLLTGKVGLQEELPRPIRKTDEFYLNPHELRVKFDSDEQDFGLTPQWVWQSGSNQNSVLGVATKTKANGLFTLGTGGQRLTVTGAIGAKVAGSQLTVKTGNTSAVATILTSGDESARIWFPLGGISVEVGSIIEIDSKEVEVEFVEQLNYPSRAPSKGDTLVVAGVITDQMKLNYVGRRTISRYGCYACHDIPGFSEARPIGTTLQDWGRKDKSKLALEHISEYLHHHGEGDDNHGSTQERAQNAIAKAKAGGLKAGEFSSEAEENREMSVAYFYQDLLHHGRAGFLWQKLRQPRSYDFKKTETKGYDERLRMPKFPINDEEIEAIATFVLGLVAEPPAEEYLYRPAGPVGDRIKGEELLDKYNCTGCHIVDLPKVQFGASMENLNLSELGDSDHAAGRDLMFHLRPPVEADTGIKHVSQYRFYRWLSDFSGDPGDHSDAMKSQVAELRKAGLRTRDLKRIAALVATDAPADLEGDAKTDYESFFASNRVTLANVIGKHVIQFEGLITFPPDLENPVEDQEYSFHLWNNLKVRLGGRDEREIWPSSTISFAAPDLVNLQPARGGDYAEWLVTELTPRGKSRGEAWQRVPPPLYKEGMKVQTPWLFNFLKNPFRLRPIVVLRMPRFNMSDDEAQSLANYFAAYDGVEYPYQSVPQREAPYIEGMDHQLKTALSEDEDYLGAAWKVLNGPDCKNCHLVAGHKKAAVSTSKDQIQGPDLKYVSNRLRTDWVQLWLYKPQWITPYSGMVAPFKNGSGGYHGVLDGDPGLQTQAVRDALMNYHELMERHGKTDFVPLKKPVADTVAPPTKE